jgi:inactivated superfamily I helicase
MLSSESRIEVYTDRVTIVIFTSERRLARVAVAQLQGTIGGRRIHAGEPLPPPAPGVLNGRLPCNGQR